MKYGRKLLGLVLSLVLMLGLLPVTALADDTVLVYSYEELVDAMTPGSANHFGSRLVIAPKNFSWPEGPVTLDLYDPAIDNGYRTLFVGDTQYFPEKGDTWVIPENVTVNQRSSVTLDAGIVCNGTWNMVEKNGGSEMKLIAVQRPFVSNGSMTLSETVEGRLELNSDTRLAGNLRLTGELILGDGTVLTHTGEYGSIALWGGGIHCPKGGAQVKCGLQIRPGHVDYVTPHTIFSGNLLMENIKLIDTVQGKPEGATRVVFRGGGIKLGTILIEKNTTVEIAGDCRLTGDVSSRYGGGLLKLDGQLTINRESSPHHVELGPKGLLRLPAETAIKWEPAQSAPHISGTGTIHADMGSARYWQESSGSIKLVGPDYNNNILLDDSPDRLSARQTYIDSTVTLERDWIFETPADGLYPVESSVVDQYGNPVPGCTVQVIPWGRHPQAVDHVRMRDENDSRDYDVAVKGIPAGQRVAAIRIGSENEIQHYIYRDTAVMYNTDMILGGKAPVAVELEPIPAELPALTSVTLYQGRGQNSAPAPEQQDVTEEIVLELEPDSGWTLDHALLYGVWQYSLDGRNWQDFMGGALMQSLWSKRCEVDFLTQSFDLRCVVPAAPRYFTMEGDCVVSNVIHINGGGDPAAPLVKPEDIDVYPNFILCWPSILPKTGTCVVAVYDSQGRLLNVGAERFEQAEDGSFYFEMDTTGYAEIRVFGLSTQGAPLCGAGVAAAPSKT